MRLQRCISPMETAELLDEGRADERAPERSRSPTVVTVVTSCLKEGLTENVSSSTPARFSAYPRHWGCRGLALILIRRQFDHFPVIRHAKDVTAVF